ncbi:UBC-like protein [Tilletiopsis washingtonensis]|uniref:UBC-like protein n=1 Tax=Tilletiopsis washingtonensis TaxID=58919 RepID=A0A316ZF19_9BASI|nr:UBC-like protein [Tilletiopsis washingtonensis]PWO00341.1 UBC-like protein [Tilletiopsis washingtonensis]
MTLPPAIMRRLTRELARLHANPPEDYRVVLNEEDILDVAVWIRGPEGTPFEGGYFKLTIDFLAGDYPNSPPHCLLRTKIFHPNVSTKGDICVSTLKKGWDAQTGVDFLVRTIISLLLDPNPDSVLDQAEAGRLMHDSYEDFHKTARIWTSVHASTRPDCFGPASPASASKMASHDAAPLASTQTVAPQTSSNAGTGPATLCPPAAAALPSLPQGSIAGLPSSCAPLSLGGGGVLKKTSVPKRGLRRL